MIVLRSMQVPGSVVFSARVADDGFEHQFWDPGSSKFTRISFCFAAAQHHAFLVAGFEHYFWDPGLAAGSVFMEFGTSHVGFHWDPGSPKRLQSIVVADLVPAHLHGLPRECWQMLWDPGLLDCPKAIALTRFCVEFCPTKHQWFSTIWMTQQKCSGPYIIDWIVEFVQSTISNIVGLSIGKSSQFIPAPEGIWKLSTIFVVYMDLAVLPPWQYNLLVQITQRDIICVTEM
jgi:hypothetical protein